MKLFLTSSGFSDENEKSFLELLGRDPKGLHVAFIRTAINEEPQEVKDKYIPIDKADLEALGMIVNFVDLEMLSPETIVHVFAPFDLVYVYGGNTFYLMNHANKSGFKDHIQEILKNKVYIGVSAGSIIVGPSIEAASWGKEHDRNTVGLRDLRGMSLVSFVTVPHYKGEMLKEAAGYPYEIRYIKDGEAIVIND